MITRDTLVARLTTLQTEHQKAVAAFDQAKRQADTLAGAILLTQELLASIPDPTVAVDPPSVEPIRRVGRKSTTPVQP